MNEKVDVLSKIATIEEELEVGVMYEIKTSPSVSRQMVTTITILADKD